MKRELREAESRVIAAVKRIYPDHRVGDPYPEPCDFDELQAAVLSLRRIESGDEQEAEYRRVVREMGFGVPGHQC